MSIKIFLSDDHKACDNAFVDMENAINDGKDASELYKTTKDAFYRHFKMEEEVMFPEFEGASGMACGPTQVMRMEHEQMKMTIDKLEGAISSNDKTKALGICETLNMLVQQHNSKEEQILYTMANNILNNDEIVEKMKSV